MDNIYETIIIKADDRTIINMMIANPKLYRNDQIWRRIIQHKYPLLLNFKNDKESYKHLYLTMIKSIALLKEKFNFPYIPTKSFNPRIFYKNFFKNKTGLLRKENLNIWEHGIKYAIESENNFYINLMIENGAKNFNENMQLRNNDYNFKKKMEEMNILFKNYSIKYPENKFKDELSIAAYFGYTDLIYLFIDKEYDLESALIKSIEGNQLGSFKYILQNGFFTNNGTEIENVFILAYKLNLYNFIEYLLSDEASKFVLQIVNAIKNIQLNDNTNINELIKKWVVKNSIFFTNFPQSRISYYLKK